MTKFYVSRHTISSKYFPCIMQRSWCRDPTKPIEVGHTKSDEGTCYSCWVIKNVLKSLFTITLKSLMNARSFITKVVYILDVTWWLQVIKLSWVHVISIFRKWVCCRKNYSCMKFHHKGNLHSNMPRPLTSTNQPRGASQWYLINYS